MDSVSTSGMGRGDVSESFLRQHQKNLVICSEGDFEAS